MIKQYKFAGVEISVSIPDEKMYTDEYHLTDFAVEQVIDPSEFCFELVDKLAMPEGELITNQSGYCVYQKGEERIRYIGSVQSTLDGAYIRTYTNGKNNHVQLLAEKYPTMIGPKTMLNAIDIQKLLVEANGFILHCSYIEKNGKAILFTAPSETGKSTQADLWNQYRGAEIINGDRAAVRLVNGEILAEGVPFAGSSKYCKNRSFPIEAIVYLSQGPETKIRNMTGREAFARIWEGISLNTWDKADVEKVFGIVQYLIEQVPVYHLECTPDESAVLALELAIKERL